MTDVSEVLLTHPFPGQRIQLLDSLSDQRSRSSVPKFTTTERIVMTSLLIKQWSLMDGSVVATKEVLLLTTQFSPQSVSKKLIDV